MRISELFSDSINSIPLAILIGIFFIFFVGGALPLIEILRKELPRIFKIELETVTSPIWDGNIAESSHITSIGNTLYGNYAMWLIITTVILLLAMVGCIVITLKDKNSNTGVTSNDSIPHSFTYMPLQSGIFTIKKAMDIYWKIFLFLFFNQHKIIYRIYMASYIYICVVCVINFYYGFHVYCASSQDSTNPFQSYNTATADSNATNVYSTSGTTIDDANKFNSLSEELLKRSEKLIADRHIMGAPSNHVTLTDLNINKFGPKAYPLVNDLYDKHPEWFNKQNYAATNITKLCTQIQGYYGNNR